MKQDLSARSAEQFFDATENQAIEEKRLIWQLRDSTNKYVYRNLPKLLDENPEMTGSNED